MARFDLYVADETRKIVRYTYNNETSELRTEFGAPVAIPAYLRDLNLTAAKRSRNVPLDQLGYVRPSPDQPGVKVKGGLRVVKIQLGLGCNYDCSYCLQAQQPRTGSTPKEVDDFVAKMNDWVGDDVEGLSFEFRGGEPFVYWKTLKPLAEKIREKYPSAIFSVCTNGSLLDAEKNDWLVRLGFRVSVSHDGPGQFVRGPDPLDVPEQRAAILELYRRLAPEGRFAFAAMLNVKNQSRAAIRKFFQKVTGDENPPLSEGGIIDSYDDEGIGLSFDPISSLHFRRNAYVEAIQGLTEGFALPVTKVLSFVGGVANGRNAKFVTQKCGMDMPNQIAVDMKGNVLTCQNVQASETGINGNSHKIGHVDDLDAVRLNTVKHWENRPGCSKCPVLQVCGGSCMYLDGEMFSVSCENSYTDNVVFFALGLREIVGGTLIYIDSPDLPEDRKNVFGMAEVIDGVVRLVDGERIVLPAVKQRKKVIPIAVEH